MKVLHVIHSLDPRSGGPSHALRGLVVQQVAAGKEVSVLGTTAQTSEPWAPNDEHVKSMHADPAFRDVILFLGRAYGRRPRWNRYGFSPACSRWLERRCAEPDVRPDVIHIHGVYAHISAMAAAVAQRHGIPYVIRPAGSLEPLAICHRSALLKRIMIRTQLRRHLQKTAFVQAMSEEEASHLRQVAVGATVVVVPHGINVPQRPSGKSIEQFLARLPGLRGKRILLFIGRLHSKKQPELLVRALARVQHEFPDLVLLMAGPDAGQQSVVESVVRSEQLEDRVLFPGFLQGKMKDAAFAAANVFALPSQYENFGVAVLEAMAHAVPVLVSPHVATHSYVDAADAGLTIPNTVEGLVTGLRQLLGHDSARLGMNGRHYVEAHLSWQAVERQLAGYYKTALDTHPPAQPVHCAPSTHRDA